MSRWLQIICAVMLCTCAIVRAEDPARANLLLLTQSKGFEHPVVKEKDGKPSVVETTLRQLGDKTKLFNLQATKDASIITPDKLKNTHLIVFYTTEDLPIA